MNFFYNKAGIGDTLMISIHDIDENDRIIEQKGNVVRIVDQTTGQTAGYNIFNISEYVSVDSKGVVEVTEELVHTINDLLEKNQFKDQLEGDFSPKFVVGHVKEKSKHPNADKLSVCKVDVGDEELQIVCGAPNVEVDQKVVVAKVGAVMPGGMVIKEAQLRGVESYGMICSAKELNLANAPKEKGILVLSDEYKIGQPFNF